MAGRVSPRTRARHSQEEILRAAAPLFAAHGYHGLSMRDLARASGQSLANLYNYVASKDDLLFEIQSRAFETLIASAREAAGAADSSEAALYAFVYNHVRYVAAHRDIMRILVEEAGALPPKRRRAVRELKERYYLLGLGHLRAVAEDGACAPAAGGARTADMELERATYNVFGMLNWVYAWYDPARHGRPEDVARSIHRVALCGLAARCPSREAQRDTERRVAGVEVAPLLRLVVKGEGA
jgi:AcrR family transcriptional regulator